MLDSHLWCMGFYIHTDKNGAFCNQTKQYNQMQKRYGIAV